MVYYNDNELIIRNMEEADARILTDEEIAGKYADTVWLGVGLHSGYGSAQRMYVKRGYIPDGTGVWYRNKPCAQYETEIANDDNLVLFLSKKLERQDGN